MRSAATTVQEYLDQLPDERRTAIAAVRKVVLKNLPKGYEETMQYGGISYVVPLNLFPYGYLGRKNEALAYATLVSQKNYMSIYLMTVYGNSEISAWFKKAYQASGKKLDMGKACIRFKKLEDLPLDVIGQAIARTSLKDYVTLCERAWKK